MPKLKSILLLRKSTCKEAQLKKVVQIKISSESLRTFHLEAYSLAKKVQLKEVVQLKRTSSTCKMKLLKYTHKKLA